MIISINEQISQTAIPTQFQFGVVEQYAFIVSRKMFFHFLQNMCSQFSRNVCDLFDTFLVDYGKHNSIDFHQVFTRNYRTVAGHLFCASYDLENVRQGQHLQEL